MDKLRCSHCMSKNEIFSHGFQIHIYEKKKNTVWTMYIVRHIGSLYSACVRVDDYQHIYNKKSTHNIDFAWNNRCGEICVGPNCLIDIFRWRANSACMMIGYRWADGYNMVGILKRVEIERSNKLPCYRWSCVNIIH